MRIARLGGLVVVMTLMLGVSSARAALITFTDEAAWQAAVAALSLGVAVEDFSDATLLSGLSTTNGSIAGGTFNALANTQFNNAGNPILTFAGGVQAFGGFWDLSPGGNGDGLLFMINGTAAVPSGTQALFQASPFSGFIGFVDTTGLITSLRLDSPGTGNESFSLDNLALSTAQSTPVPEPGTLSLLGLGLVATIRAARKRIAR